MRFGIRAQLLVPLVPLALGLAATTTWTAYSAAAAARQKIFDELSHMAETVTQVTFPRNMQTLRLMKGLSGADLMVCDSLGRPLDDAQGQPLTTLPIAPTDLPEPNQTSEPLKVRVGQADYLCRGVRLQHDRLYLFVPAAALEEAIARAVRPALVIGGVGGLAALLLALWGTQRLTRRIQLLQRRTRLIAAGDFSPMPLSPRSDELRDLGESINDMAQQLARFQETLKATERLRLLGQVSGGLAHQLRNGIAGAKLALQVLAREFGRSEAPQSLQVALRQLALMENYVTRFLDLGKALEIRRDPVDLGALAEETATLLRPQCDHARIALLVEVPKALPTFLGDAGQLRQVFFNLTTNAIEAAGPGGRVALRISSADDTITIDVLDSGPGVSAAIAGRLFEPFVTGKPEGVGLGLAVARQIVEAHGGSLTWSREANETHFRASLPCPAKS